MPISLLYKGITLEAESFIQFVSTIQIQCIGLNEPCTHRYCEF